MELIRHKLVSATEEASYSFEILDIETRGILLWWQQKSEALISMHGSTAYVHL